MTDKANSLESEIKAMAESLGFSLCGITTALEMKTHSAYLSWLDRGMQAGMQYLATQYHIEIRRAPEKLYPNLKSIIVLGLPYSLHPIEALRQNETGLVCGYAAGEDYHARIPRLLSPLISFLTEIDPSLPPPRVYSDSAPILERELATRAGLGWVGKNSCILSQSHGSAFLLAEIFTALQLEPDKPFVGDHCGTCTRCIEACPTHCILPGRVIDSNRCLSYQLIENKGDIPAEIREQMGVWLFGCDICQMVCPWNTAPAKFKSHQNAEQFSLIEMEEILIFSQQDYTDRFKSTALARTRWRGLIRNILIRLANMKSVNSVELIRRTQTNCQDPVVQATAQWALEQLNQA